VSAKPELQSGPRSAVILPLVARPRSLALDPD
jgi:hypothetical protein